MRICNVCKIGKPLDSYHNCKVFPLGKTYTCKECAKQKTLNWNADNYKRKRETAKKEYQKNKPAYIARVAKRKAAKLQATPAWADLEQIKRIYTVCASITESTGVLHHVDHIIPLQGEAVCGLHVEKNLAIIPAQMNLQKSNTYTTWDTD